MLEKEKQRKKTLKVYIRKKLKVRIVINEMINKWTIEKIDKTKVVFLKN